MAVPRSSSPYIRRLLEVKDVMREAQAVWGWETDDGPLLQKDEKGRTLMPLWKSEASARAGNDGAGEPVRYPFAELAERVAGWTRAGVKRYGLEPDPKYFLLVLRPDEVVNYLLHGRYFDSRLP